MIAPGWLDYFCKHIWIHHDKNKVLHNSGEGQDLSHIAVKGLAKTQNQIWEFFKVK